MNLTFLGGFRKMNIWGEVGGYFLGSSQNWTLFNGHFYVIKDFFLRSRYRRGIFLGC